MGPELWSRARALITHNRGAKGLSLVLGAITWHTIQQTINFESVVSDVPLTFRVDPGWAVLERSTDTVDVHFRGAQEDLWRLTRETVEVVVDVRGKSGRGQLTVALRPHQVRAPGGVRAVFLQPDAVTFSVDREGEKQVPVRAEIQGSPPEGYEVEKVVCTPAVVTVRGPMQRLEELECVRTAPIDLEGRLRSFRVRAALVPPSATWIARVEPDKVLAEVTLIERSDEREVADVPVRVLSDTGARAAVGVTPSRVKVHLRGQPEALDRVRAEDLDAYVDCTRLDPAARYDLPVRVFAPPGIKVVGAEPETVQVMPLGP